LYIVRIFVVSTIRGD